jgi:hypothetical protein
VFDTVLNISETATGTDSIQGRKLWELIDDSQTPNWGDINTTQSANWGLISS